MGHSPPDIHGRFDRFAWPVVATLLVFALVAVSVAAIQAAQIREAYRDRDEAIVRATAQFAENYLGTRRAEEADWITRNGPTFVNRPEGLTDAIRNDYLGQNAPRGVEAVVVARFDGSVIATVVDDPQLGAGAALMEQLGPELQSLARSAAGARTPIVSGRLEFDDRLYIAQATPLSYAGYGVWISLLDVGDSPLGILQTTSKEGGSTPVLVDDQGRPLLSIDAPRDQGAGIARHPIEGTRWQAVMPNTAPPRGIPTWLLVLLAISFLILGALYWVQEGTRRTLRSESEVAARRTRRLYELANDLIRAGSVQSQGTLLARAMLDALSLSGVRVIFATGDERSVVVGRADPRSHRYRLALRGPRGTIGEVIAFTEDGPLDERQRAVVRTMAALAGATMHNAQVLDRERETARELQRLDELRTNLLSTVAHELRSPLTAIKGMLGLLAMQDDLTGKQSEYIEVAIERTDSLVELIQDLFDCSLMESGQLSVKPERRLARGLLNSTLGALATSRPDELVLSAPPEAFITADPLRFDQIVNNLVTNAFRHGKAPVEVSLRPYPQGMRLIVADHGPGIPETERDQVFGKFYQSDSGHARLVEGAGLGLALVQGLVALHGGSIELDSHLPDGTGCRFTIFFPDVADGLENEPALELPETDDLAALREII